MSLREIELEARIKELEAEIERHKEIFLQSIKLLQEARDHIRNCFGTDDRPDSDSGFIVRDCDTFLRKVQ